MNWMIQWLSLLELAQDPSNTEDSWFDDGGDTLVGGEDEDEELRAQGTLNLMDLITLIWPYRQLWSSREPGLLGINSSQSKEGQVSREQKGKGKPSLY